VLTLLRIRGRRAAILAAIRLCPMEKVGVAARTFAGR
jgi:hypothetical protein